MNESEDAYLDSLRINKYNIPIVLNYCDDILIKQVYEISHVNEWNRNAGKKWFNYWTKVSKWIVLERSKVIWMSDYCMHWNSPEKKTNNLKCCVFENKKQSKQRIKDTQTLTLDDLSNHLHSQKDLLLENYWLPDGDSIEYWLVGGLE